ncbi:MAG: beta-lactamase family protein [Polyangiaceae bacterium]|nr:beta-lactamase family protein [Polyangiaceae bacterium]
MLAALVPLDCSPLTESCPVAPFAYPATPAGAVVAEYVNAFDSGNAATWARFQARYERSHHGTAKEYKRMHADLGCLEPLSIEHTPEAEALLTETAHGGYYELSFAFDDGGHLLFVRTMPAMGPGQNEPPSLRAAADEIGAEVDALSRQDRFSGAVLITRHGQPVLARAVGFADRAAHIPNQLETRFNIGSVGKTFTAVAIAQLVEQGKLRFDEPLGAILPDYPLPAALGITLPQLLMHTSGLGDITGFTRAKPAPETASDFITLFGRAPLLFAPGASHRYSNLGYEVLGRVVEVASGQPFDAYVAAHVFLPLRMTETGAAPEEASKRAIRYTRPGNDAAIEPREPTEPLPPLGGIGCEWSTVGDLARYGDALLGSRLLGAATAEAMLTPHTAWGLPSRPDRLERGYGYGFVSDRIDGARVAYQDGGAPGLSAFFALFPEADVVLVVLANQDPPSTLAMRAMKLIAYAASHGAATGVASTGGSP